MKTLKIYYIDDEYINYLRKFDSKVPFNKNNTRPYIGVVYSFNDKNYFAPLSSPKPKHIKMNAKAIDIFKINNGKWGIVNINNMIPTPIECLTEVLPSVKDEQYRNLLENQTTYINNHRKELLTKVKQFQTQYQKGYLSTTVRERCCDFKLLEEKCKEYTNISNQRTRVKSIYDDFDIEK